MECINCKYYVGNVDETTDCYQETCPYVGREEEDEDWKHELLKRADKPRVKSPGSPASPASPDTPKV